MPLTPDFLGALPPGLSPLQRGLELRRRCYQERIVRGQYGKHPGWDSGPHAQGASFCDLTHYRLQQESPCKSLVGFAVTPKNPNESVFMRLARLDIVSRQPERQQEIFGWVTPPRNDFAAATAFEVAKARYWQGPVPVAAPPGASLAESLDEVYSMQDTADFHANYLLRLLYLYGETPAYMRNHRTRWRRLGQFGRDVNFSESAESLIRDNLLAFKYWLDEPFFADDAGAAKLCQWRFERARQRWKQSTDPHKKEPSKNPNDDSYKFEMTYWSENHQVLFPTAEYLAGQLWPDAIFRPGNQFRLEGQDKTRPSDLLGWQRMQRAKPRLMRWLNDRLLFGFSEWNAPGYYEEDFTALFNLADFCLDDEIQIRASMVLDLLLFDLARFTCRGSFGSTAGRCYFEQKNCGYEQSVGDLIEILFGTRGLVVEAASTSAGAFASSRCYRMPDVLLSIGQDAKAEFIDRARVSLNFEDAAQYGIGFESDADILFWWSRGAFFVKELIVSTLALATRCHLMKTSPFQEVLPKLLRVANAEASLEPSLNPFAQVRETVAAIGGGESLDDRARSRLVALADECSVLTEGPALTRANLYTCRSPGAMLSSAQNFRAGQMSVQVQACQATLSLSATVWTTYPSAGDILQLSGTPDGPNWWTGSVTAPRVIQWQNAAIIAYKPKDLQLLLFGHRTHAWFPKDAFDAGSVLQRAANCNRDDSVWTFGKVGDGYVGLFSAQAPQWTTTGSWAGKELIAEGARNFFVIQIGTAAHFGSYSDFAEKVSSARVHVSGVSGAVAEVVAGALLGHKVPSEKFECSYDIPGGDRLELHYDDNEVRYAGRQFSDDNYPRFENPYVKCGRVYWGQCFYTIAHAGHSLTHDFRNIQSPVPVGAVSPLINSLTHGFRNIQSPVHVSAVSRLIDGGSSAEYDCSTGPRPFYVVGHNPNKISEVIAALDAGANAIEPDVNVYEDRQNELCISEAGIIDSDEGGDSDAPSLARFLDKLHTIALKRPELALIVFDCKPKAATPELGATLLDQVRKRLTYDTNVNIIISVSSLSETAIFRDIKGILGPREGCMIDEENDAGAVANFFIGAGIENRCYGNGNTFQDPLTSPNLRPSIEMACGMRAGEGSFQFIYEWTNNDEERLREFIRTGVDGIITDQPSLLRGICDEDEFQPLIRLAARGDNPFQPPNANYELAVHTGDVSMAGTDANLTFTLVGAKGTAIKLIDASLDGRMERDDWNFVTIQSPDIGRLLTITVQRDNSGNAPDWYLDRIVVRSFRYGVSKQAIFDRWIDTTSPFTMALK
jgi:hypothetical protein